MTNLPKSLREKLSDRFEYTSLREVTVQTSKLDGTKKFLFELQRQCDLQFFVRKPSHLLHDAACGDRDISLADIQSVLIGDHMYEPEQIVCPGFCHVNLIPVNPIKERDFVESERKDILNFQKKLEKRHINATLCPPIPSATIKRFGRFPTGLSEVNK